MVTLPLACAVGAETAPPKPGGGDGASDVETSGVTQSSSSASGAGGASGSASGSGPTSAASGPSTGAGPGGTGGDCPHEGPPVIEPSSLPACPTSVCASGGHCVPTAVVPMDQVAKLADCDAKNKCVPDLFIATGGDFIPPSCKSLIQAEGRCLSKCVPEVAAQASLLPQSTCAQGELCVPCYNPQDGKSTGACELSCDPGPIEPPKTLPKCCNGKGTCVPASAVPADKQKNLDGDGCPPGDNLLCAPDVFVKDQGWKPPKCETSLVSSFFGADYKPGACLPDCLKAVDNFLIQQDGCADGFKCAPCLKPPFGQPSGACEL
jgi:hypothetical protein